MAKYIQDKNGQMAGSIGDGKAGVPTASDLPSAMGAHPSAAGSEEDIRRAWDAFRTAQNAARDDDYIHANLAGSVFSGEDFSGVDFSHADLSGAAFTDCNLSGADFSHATMSGVTFRRVTAPGAVFAYADMTGARFQQCDLPYANLAHSQLDNSHISSADLSHADAEYASFERAHLSGVNARHGNFTLSGWDRADLHAVDLADCDLTGASFTVKSADGLRLSRTRMKNTAYDPQVIKRAAVGGATLRDAAPVRPGPSLFTEVKRVLGADRWRRTD